MKQHTRKNSAFTLIEIMVVVVIIGILAAAIIPQVIGTTEDAKISTAKGDISTLENALERFNLNMDRYPSSEEGLKVLTEAPPGDEQKWRGPYVKIVSADPWGNPYQYRMPGSHNPSNFDLWSTAGGAGGKEIGNWK
jgi:general secretion pathway protein G